MRTLTTLTFVLVTALSSVSADQIVLDSAGAAAGTVYLRIDVAQDGSLTATHVPKVFSMDVKQQTVVKIVPVPKEDPVVVTEPEPPSPPEPEENFFPPKKTDLQKAVIRLAGQVDDDNRRGSALVIAGVYADVADLIATGILTELPDVWRATNIQYDATIRRYRKQDNWLKWKTDTQKLLEPKDVTEAMDLWNEVAEALRDVENVGD